MTHFKMLLLPVILLSGCGRYIAYEPTPSSYYLNSSKDLKTIGRTALVELVNKSAVPQVSSDVTEALFQEIQKEQIFGLTKIRQNDPAWRRLQLDIDTSYTFDELLEIRKALKCDAILIGTITGFEPYPHMALGLRLRLFDLSDGRLIWGLEQVWDTTDKETQERIEAYYNPKKFMIRSESLSGQLGSVSSIKFFKFVAHEVTETLQSNW